MKSKSLFWLDQKLQNSWPKNLEENIIVLSLSKSLILWYKIEKFLKVGHITKDRVETFDKDIDKFEGDIQAFYDCGITSFMTKKLLGIQKLITFIVYGFIYLSLHERLGKLIRLELGAIQCRVLRGGIRNQRIAWENSVTINKIRSLKAWDACGTFSSMRKRVK